MSQISLLDQLREEYDSVDPWLDRGSELFEPVDEENGEEVVGSVARDEEFRRWHHLYWNEHGRCRRERLTGDDLTIHRERKAILEAIILHVFHSRFRTVVGGKALGVRENWQVVCYDDELEITSSDKTLRQGQALSPLELFLLPFPRHPYPGFPDWFSGSN
ncbi:MAG: hypothetical protein COU08_03020 [Candidatus Harrisonbacteria bacterium CG10_big_fil_rev_8_21_14_0_10_42_17]|uniref:Uncharacterized protein n=1 Tax=Candidatus Harrisonbacteria bacterium CG10_big_fil_rev_8_21_14_0_10_42_17 TaxID=1974584 RepID=A0A2M6WHJ0_9BACT|nr:MAG: hypothetical protein COU08_03020 [Candidatus Harrisonbacteria bacterium CG10_big_fil_rev_8_21_14_0_10_42_17]